MPTYTHLTTEDRQQIIDGQIRQFEGELFAHELNLVRLNALREEDRDPKAVAASEAAISTIEHAIAVTAAEAENL